MTTHSEDHAIIYVPSDTPEAMALAPRKVAGVPLIVRGIMTLAEAGIESCTLLIAAPQRERIEKFLNRYREERIPLIDMVTYDEPYRVSPAMIDAIAGKLKQRVLLINANLLFDKHLVQTIYEHDPNDDRLFICREGVHPLPIMEVTRESWRSLASFTLEAPRSIESCINHLLAAFPHREVQKPANVSTFLLKRREDIPVAEKFLSESVRLATNGPIARILNKRLSLPFSMVLSKLWVSPHAVTSFNIIIGLLSGVFLAGKGYISLLIGASLFQLASVADGIDGEIAKLTFRTSKFGQYIDTVSDNLALASALIGLTIGSYRTLQSNAVFVAGAIALIGIGIIVTMMISFLKRNTDSASLVAFDKEYLQRRSSSDHPIIMTFLRYSKHFAKKDIFSFLIFAFAVAGLVQYWLFAIALGAFLGSTALIYLNIADVRCARTASASAARASGKKLKKMVVFDFDGTLVNSMEAFADIAARVMPRYFDITPARARRCYLETSGLPFFQQLETLFPNHPNNKRAAEDFETIKKQSYFERPVFSDVAATIDDLRKRNVKVAVSSNNFQELVDQYIGRTGMRFDVVMGYRDNFAKGEDHFRHIEQHYGIARDEMTFVGDSLKDGDRAAASGVSFVAKEGIFSKEEFRKRFPDVAVVKTLTDLKNVLGEESE